MGSSSDVFKMVVLENSTWAVVRTDPARPRFMEVIANFYDEKRAKDYMDLLNGQIEQPQRTGQCGSSRACTGISQTRCRRGRTQLTAKRRFEGAS